MIATALAIFAVDWAGTVSPPPSTPYTGTAVHAGIPYAVRDSGVTTLCISSSSGQALAPFVLASK